MLETTLGVTHPVLRAKPELENPSASKSGSLQVPGWVDQLQAYNTNRWRGINSRPEPESVVNVTIGRVEVRAVQADVAKNVKSRNKASGVMSLDDYLMQCDKERE